MNIRSKRSKRIAGGIAAGVIAGAMAIGVNYNATNNNSYDLFLANVQAFATDESGSGDCWNSIETKAGHTVKYCGSNCGAVNGIASNGSSVCN